MLTKLEPMHPKLFREFVKEDDQLAGIVMAYIEGEKLENMFRKKDSLFYQSPSARLDLVRAIGLNVKKIQNMGICHGDLNMGNVMVYQPNKESSLDVRATIIDYGNAFEFDGSTRTSTLLTGLTYLRPPESRRGKLYNPSGVNAYQFTRLALLILTRNPEASNENVSSSPEKELELLSQSGYDQSFIDYLSAGLSIDIGQRNAFFENIDSLSLFKIDDSKIDQTKLLSFESELNIVC